MIYENKILDKAILNTYPDGRSSHLGTVETIESIYGDFDLELISNEVTRLQAEYDSLEYSRLRKAEYDKLSQDEMRYDDLKNNTNTWELAIDAIKLEHPKE